MPNYSRIRALVQSTVWLIEPQRGQVMADAFFERLEAGPRREPFLSADELQHNKDRAVVRHYPMAPASGGRSQQQVAVIPMFGAILPRGDAMAEISGGGAVNLMRFQQEFTAAANDPGVGVIVLEFDSPGGDVTLVPETAEIIKAARRADRPIIAMANTMACSAAYWLACACDEISVTPTGMVGSIGVFQLHQNMQKRAEMEGMKFTYIFEGPRKIEGNPFEEMGDAARASFQKSCRTIYDAFTADVAKLRGAKLAHVQADPEAGGKSFGGGRAYRAIQLDEMGLIGRGGMADRIETMPQLMARLTSKGGGANGGGKRRGARASIARHRLALM